MLIVVTEQMHVEPKQNDKCVCIRVTDAYVRGKKRQQCGLNTRVYFCPVSFQMESNNHFNYGTHSSANSGLKLSSGDSLYANGSSASFPQQGKSKYFLLSLSVCVE